MRSTSGRRSVLVSLACLAALVADAGADSRSRARRKPATQADIERLEQKLAAQQQLIDNLIALHQQYLEALVRLTGGKSAGDRPVLIDKPAERVAVADKPVERVAEKPAEKSADKPAVKTADKAADKPADKRKEKGSGTVVGQVTGVTDAVVYVEDISASTSGSATMNQEGKQFVPQVLIVQKGTKVSFPNRDAIFHNVFSMSPDNTFDLGSYKQGDSKTVTMSRAGVVTVYCNMHPQMVGHILVVPNGNYVRAGKDGFFKLPDVPAGKHRIVAWAPNSKPVTVDAAVTDGEVVTVEIALKKGRSATHTKKDGMPYGSYDQ
jgi:plastocyanin